MKVLVDTSVWSLALRKKTLTTDKDFIQFSKVIPIKIYKFR
jgi:hypothetical protein